MKFIGLIFAFLMLCSFNLIAQYNENYVSVSSETIDNEIYSVIEMTRKDERVKVKYFADKDLAGRSVYQRYLTWSKNKSIIASCSGTYYGMDNKPVGICIDEGQTVNKAEAAMDALVLVYRTGGIVVTDLKEGNLTVQNGAENLSLNLKNPVDRTKFFLWSKENYATVFQTHLLYYKNKLRVGANGDKELRERRFLAVARDDENKIRYYLINLKGNNTLYNATVKVEGHLKNYTDNIIYIINLDTGAQDYFEVREAQGKVMSEPGFKGNKPLNVSKNLLVFYFE